MKSIFGQKDLMLLGANVLITLALVAGFTLSTNQGSIGSEGPSGPAGSQGLPGSNGVDGSDGLPGEPGEDGETPYIGVNGNWWIGDTDTGVSTNSNGEVFPETDYSQNPRPVRYELAISAYEDYLNDNPTTFNQTTYVSNLINNQDYTGISTGQEFFELIALNPSGKFVLENDINFGSISSWAELPTFSGTLDGGNYALRNLSSEAFDSSTVEISLFNYIDGATIKNIKLDTFTFDVDPTPSETGRSGLLATVITDSFLYNLTIISSSFSGFDYVGLVSRELTNSKIYNTTILDSSVSSMGDSGLLFSFTEHSQIMGTYIENSTISNTFGYSGGVVGSTYKTMIHDVVVRDVSFSVNQGLAGGTQEIRNNGFVVGSAEDTFIDNARVVGSQFIMLSLEAVANAIIVNFGGIVGYGEEIILMNSQYGEFDSLDTMFDWDSYYFDANHDVFIEYIGGIAGYLSDYTLISVENHVNVAVQDTVRDDLNNNSIAGILGYSSRQGFIYEAVNYGQVLGQYAVAGILGGVGFLVQLGNIYIDKVANYGSIYGWLAVSGIVGSLDGATALTLRNALQSGYVMGFGGVGGLVGELFLDGLPAVVENSVVQGQVFGIFDLGGVIGTYQNNSQSFSLLTMNRILMVAEVWNMVLGFVMFDENLLTFDSANEDVFIFATPYSGLIIGSRNAAAVLTQVVAYQPVLEQDLFQVNFDTSLFTYLDTTMTGSFEAVGDGQGVGIILFNSRELTTDNAFIQNFFGRSTPWMTVIAEDEIVVVLDGISDVTPLQLAFESRPLFYLPYLRHIVFTMLLP